MTDSSRKLKELLEAERLATAPTADDRKRNRVGLARQLGMGAALGLSSIASSTWGAWIASAPVKFLATVALAAAGSGSMAWVVSGMRAGSEPASPPATAARTAAARDTRTEPRVGAPASASPTGPDAPQAGPAELAASPSKKSGPSDAAPAALPAEAVDPALRSADTLGAQARLLAETRKALGSGNPAKAVALLDEAASLANAGPLAEELAATRVFALCQLGRRAEARQSAGGFAQRFPGSPLLARVQSACSSER